jgi:hypothetical protein
MDSKFITTRGATDVRNSIAEFLKNELPAQIEAARLIWSLDQYTLPKPLSYSGVQPLQGDVYPAINVAIQRDSDWTFLDYDSYAGTQFRVTWNVRIYIWVKTPQTENGSWVSPEYDSTIQLRDDMSTVVRATLLSRLSFANPGFQLVPETIMTDYMDTKPLGEKRPDFVSLSMIAFELTTEETVARDSLGIVQFTKVEPEKVGSDYPLDDVIIGHVP